MNKISKWLTPFIHVVPAEYEAWFEALAADGWHPKNIGHLSSMRMTFIKSEQKKYRYVIDLQANLKAEYKTTYGDFGWEFVGQMSSIFVWRMEYTNEPPESFSDSDSLQKRNNRFTVIIAILFAMFALAAVGVTVVYTVFFTQLSTEQHINCISGMIFSYILSLLLGCVLRKIHQNKP